MNNLCKAFVIGFYLALNLCIAGCSVSSSWLQTIPDTEIVLQSTMNRRPYNLIFIQSDDSSSQPLTLEENFVKPFWSSDGTILYGLSSPVGQTPYEDIGYPAYWDTKTNAFKRCDIELPYFGQVESYDSTTSTKEVLLYNVSEIILFDLDTCEQKTTLVDYSDRTGEYAISGFSYFPETQELLYGRYTVPHEEREYALMKLNTHTGEQIKLAEGVNPAWSPDGKQIAYLGVDGLYVMQSNDKQPRLLISERFFDVDSAGGPALNTPQPRWSPDGKWLVYHLCVNDACEVTEAEIYKVGVSDGLSTKLFTGGKFPAWKP